MRAPLFIRFPPRFRAVAWGLLGLITGFRPVSAEEAATAFIAPARAEIHYSDYVAMETQADGSIRFNRIIDPSAGGYRWDNPGARVRFRTDARSLMVRLRYSEAHSSRTARAPIGVFFIDGRTQPDWTFSSHAREIVRPAELRDIALPAPKVRGFHDYAIVLPYGDSVDFVGLSVNQDARFEEPAPRPRTRFVAYGDSVTQGFTASDIAHTYVYQTADARGWQMVNLGIAGRTSHVADAEVVGQANGDIVCVLIGVNDWQNGVPPQDYARTMDKFFAQLRAIQPDAPIYAVTPLWVHPDWKPQLARFPLESYRAELRAVTASRHDPRLHLIEGPDLIDHDLKYFDPVNVHPNDAGFAQMAQRLAGRLQLPGLP